MKKGFGFLSRLEVGIHKNTKSKISPIVCHWKRVNKEDCDGAFYNDAVPKTTNNFKILFTGQKV